MEVLRHEVSAWTVGQLRKALADFPDDMAVRVAPLEEPGGDLEAPLQVVTSTEVRDFADGPGAGQPRPAGQDGNRRDSESGTYVTLECDFPSGEYSRLPG
jgi:hypothetical protein